MLYGFVFKNCFAIFEDFLSDSNMTQHVQLQHPNSKNITGVTPPTQKVPSIDFDLKRTLLANSWMPKRL